MGGRVLVVFGLAALPFLALVRGALAAHGMAALPAWASVAFGLAACFVTTGAVGLGLWTRLRGPGTRRRRERRRRLAAVVLVPALVAFSAYSLGWLAHANAKNDAVAARWSELHPVLRLALGPARLADAGLVVTEIARSPVDYDRMGLPRARRSPHYRQPDGWVHAVDLRTRGRNGVRNAALHAYYAIMGFDTLRHSGTADHLHVAMPRTRRP